MLQHASSSVDGPGASRQREGRLVMLSRQGGPARATVHRLAEIGTQPAAALRITERSASHGVFASNHHLRAGIVPASAIAATDSSRPASRRRLDWASLLKRVFATDVLVCDACGGAMRILAILPEGEASRSILEHLGLPTEPPPPRAVGPPEPVFADA